MGDPPKKAFLQFWPKCFIPFMAVIELLAALILLLTELGNVAANFWTTNVFAGGWCGLVILIHSIAVFASGCCSPGPKPAYYATIIGVIGALASLVLIGFDAYFVAQPTTCLLTPSCSTNAASNTTFSYNFQQSFYTTFNNMNPFKNFQQLQAKFLFQTIQLGVGSVCFILCLIYIIIYYVCKNKARKQVRPAPQPQQQGYYGPPIPYDYNPPPPVAQQGYYPAPPPPVAQQGYYPPAPPPPVAQPSYYPPPPAPAPPAQPQYYQAPQQAWYPQPQPPPGAIPWNANRRN